MNESESAGVNFIKQGKVLQPDCAWSEAGPLWFWDLVSAITIQPVN